MALPPNIARSGFYICSSVFTALSVYGMALHFGESPEPGSLAVTALYAAATFGSLGGIVYFGMAWDAAKREEAKTSARTVPGRRKQPKK